MTTSFALPLHKIPFPCTNSKFLSQPKMPHKLMLVRSSSGDGGQLRKPSVPLKEAKPPIRPFPVSPSLSPPPPPPPPSDSSNAATTSLPSVLSMSSSSGVTMEFQRRRAKELQEYFSQKKLEDQASQSPVFGFTPKNEISNGRWAMFGFAVGLLTEYATGSSFFDQMKILISNFGIADLE